jgi:hypothetical protein
MFRAPHRSSSGALNSICTLWFIYPCSDRPLSRLSLDNGRSPYGYINQRVKMQFRAPDDERCAARNMLSFQKFWNNKFHYKAASCWYFYWVALGHFLIDHSPIIVKLYATQGDIFIPSSNRTSIRKMDAVRPLRYFSKFKWKYTGFLLKRTVPSSVTVVGFFLAINLNLSFRNKTWRYFFIVYDITKFRNKT